MKKTSELYKVAAYLNAETSALILGLDYEILSGTYEIRLRSNRPLTLFGKFGTAFIGRDGICSSKLKNNSIIISKSELESTFRRMCEYSVHTYQQDINRGFITLSCGSRVGICGSAVCENGKITSIKDISSLNIRISREITGSADEIIKEYTGGGLIIAGPPNSGKTTVLKDIIRQLTCGCADKYYKVAVIDERQELMLNYGDREGSYAYSTCDVLDAYPKTEGIDIAVRTMSPDIIICDEVSTEEEIKSIVRGTNSGISFIVSVHAGSGDEIFSRKQFVSLAETMSFERLYLLDSKNNIGRIKEKYDIGELRNEIYCRRYGIRAECCNGV